MDPMDPWIHGSMEIHGDPRRSMQIHENPRKSMEINGSSRKSMKISGSSWKFIWNSSSKVNRCSELSKFVENYALSLLHVYSCRFAFQASSRSPESRTFRDQSIGIENSSFHALWFGIENRSNIYRISIEHL